MADECKPVEFEISTNSKQETTFINVEYIVSSFGNKWLNVQKLSSSLERQRWQV